jgi:hypothetical protein
VGSPSAPARGRCTCGPPREDPGPGARRDGSPTGPGPARGGAGEGHSSPSPARPGEGGSLLLPSPARPGRGRGGAPINPQARRWPGKGDERTEGNVGGGRVEGVEGLGGRGAEGDVRRRGASPARARSCVRQAAARALAAACAPACARRRQQRRWRRRLEGWHAHACHGGPADDGRAAARWALQAAPHSARLLLSTEIPSLACGSRRPGRAPHGLGLLRSDLLRSGEARPTPPARVMSRAVATAAAVTAAARGSE